MTNSISQQTLPQVRYHPSIQMPDRHSGSEPVVPARHTRLRSSSCPRSGGLNPTPLPMLPKVRYHPSILMPDPAAVVNTQWTRGRPAAPAQLQPRLRSPSDPGLKPQPSSSQEPGLTLNPGLVLLGTTLDRRDAERVEVLTRGQRSNPAWFSWRRNRITASVAHCIAHCRFVNGTSETPPDTYLAAVTGEGPGRMTSAMRWGVEHEDEAIQSYLESRPAVSVQACGLFVDWQRPWLAASPDGIVTDRQTGVRLRCLEVKCPFKHRHHWVEDACQDKDFCLELTSSRELPAYRLKRSHSYFTQVQCQLAVTGLLNADFVVYTTKELVVVPVAFDPDFWALTVSRLERFYQSAVVPHLRRGAPQAASHMTPA